jgi:tape measure domain-containing protein
MSGGLSGGTAYVDVALGKTDDLRKGVQAAGESAADTAKESFLSRVGSIAMGGALGNALTSGVTKVFELGKSAIFDFNSQLQQADIGFTTMLGSSKKSADFVGQLQTFAKSTPFEFGNLVANAQQMMGMGIAAKDVIPDLRALGDSVASIGGSASQVDSVTLAFNQMSAKGTLDMGNMQQLMQNGVPSALKILAAHYKVTTGEMIQMISTGKIQSSEALPALIAGIEGGTSATAALGGMMDKQSRTMAGALSNIKDSAVQSIAGAFKPAFDVASTAAQGFATFLGSDTITNASKKVGTGLTSMFTSIGDQVGKARSGWRDYNEVLDNSTGLQKLSARAHQGVADLKDIVTGFQHAKDYGGPAGSTFEEIGRKANIAYEKLQPFAAKGLDRVRDAAQKLGPVVKELITDRIATAKEIISDAIPIVENLAEKVGPVLGRVLRAAGDLLFDHVLPAVRRVSEFVQHDLVPAVMDFAAFASEHVIPVFVEIGDTISQKVAPMIGKLVDLFVQRVMPTLGPLIKDGFGLLKTVVADLTPIVQDLVHWFADYVLPVIGALASFLVGQLIPLVLQVADILIKVLRPAFEFVIAIIRDVVVPVFKIIAGVFLGLEDAGVHMASAIVTAIHGVGDVFGWIKGIATDGAKWIQDRFSDVVGWFADLPGKFAKAGSGMWDWVKDSFKSAINTVIGWWDDLKFKLPSVHIPGTNSNVGGGEIGVPYIKPLAAGGLVLPTPGGTVVRVAEAGVPEIVAPEAAIEAAVARALAAGHVGRDAPLIGTVYVPAGVDADVTAELLYGKLVARGMG